MTRWRLWIGGSSGLSQTYCAAYPNDGPWIWLGHEPIAPLWIQELQRRDEFRTSRYVSCDLIQVAQDDATPNERSLLKQVMNRIQSIVQATNADSNDCASVLDQIIVGLRPALVTHCSHVTSEQHGQALRHGLRLLLDALLQDYHDNVRLLLHISSIAAIHHIQRQHVRAWTAETDPSSTDLDQPYDRFKRGCEEVVTDVATLHANLRYTSVRLGAIFSDHPTCIQCSALALQCYTGPYLPVPIDCNSSRNVAHLIHLIVQRHATPPLRPVYYYTRCLSQYPHPVPYGAYLLAYHGANHGRSSIAAWCRRHVWVPHWLVHCCVVVPWHWFTTVLVTLVSRHIPYLESIDYLLQVSVNEHTFDMTATVEDFPQLVQLEETMEACFQRRQMSQKVGTTRL